ncbi:MAG: DUF4384 domain-containing protein [Chloroflexota bacterium]|nr:DUF4384 domain-containing protein [Chloroflexota bacterium]
MAISIRLFALGTAFAVAAMVALSQFATPIVSATEVQESSEPAYLKDLSISQVPIVRDLPTTSKPSEVGAQGLAVMSAVDRSDARYRDGDNLVLTVEVTEDAYVWVLDTGTSGKVHQIFPNRYENNNFLRAGKPVAIPHADADYQFRVSHPKGAELLTVIASKDSTPLTADLIDQETDAGAFLALRGSAASVAKDLSISLKEKESDWVTHHQVVYIQ